ncbi:MAG: glycosyltransferase family 2 protein [Chloroflexota bacterium]|nr:glycosyltransferase family 2 protein [Chloroflexota bacterium]
MSAVPPPPAPEPRPKTTRPPVAAIVLTQDEAAHILPCLRTLQWAREIVVVDSGSTDGTPELARTLNARVVHHAWVGWAGQRNFALTQVSLPWVLFVDADERVPLDLAEEMIACIEKSSIEVTTSLERTAIDERAASENERDGTPAGFWVPRQNVILGHWVRHAGWSPDYQLRLFRRERGRYDPARPVHELVQLDGRTACLDRRLVHHNYASWRQFWSKQRRYAGAEAGALAAQGTRAKARNFVLQPCREFRRRYWTLQGHRAGALGLGLCLVLALANLQMYVELWRLNHRDTATAPR